MTFEDAPTFLIQKPLSSEQRKQLAATVFEVLGDAVVCFLDGREELAVLTKTSDDISEIIHNATE